MSAVFHPASALEQTLRDAAQAAGFEGAFDPEIRAADPQHGDFQANGVLPYAKRTRQNPRAAAEKLLQALPPSLRQDWDLTVAGPGFINFTLRPAGLQAWLERFSTREALAAGAAETAPENGRTYVVDYSAPNTAKQMHVGHLRSAVIGEAIARLLAFRGARVVRDNHIGNWGTGFGKLIWAYKRHLDVAALGRDPLEEFERLYKVGNSAAETDETVLDQARQELVKLQAGDADNRAIWQRINDVSLAAFQEIYDQLGIRFDVTLGESFYNDQVSRVYEELSALGLAVESEGALVVFHPEHPRFKEQPFLIRKRDGAANYASTDLATVLYRAEHFQADAAIYVIDSRQSDHCQQLFLTAAKWFERSQRKLPRLEHTAFGTVLGENGKPLKTRSGENIKLKDLLREARERARLLVDEKSAELPETERATIAEVVGVGSVQYADLSQNRSSDYVFSWEKMISLEGNTAGYLLYAIARIRSIFRRLDLDPASPAATAGASGLETPTELALARKLVKFPDALNLAAGQLRPHFLCLYLYELAGEFSAFYNADKVAVDDLAIRARRLQLCARTLLILETGLQLLGLRTLQRM
jgi:arginyl-tRNA synthetase